MLIRGRHEKRPWLLIILAILISAVNITVLGTILGQCKPMAKLWDDTLEGTCDPGRKLNQNYSFFQASEYTLLIPELYGADIGACQASIPSLMRFSRRIRFTFSGAFK